MNKLLSLLVLVALAACVFANGVAKEDQEAAEQYFVKYGYYPSWYTYGAKAYAAPYAYSGYAAPAYAYGAYPYNYNYKTYPYGYGYSAFY